jgi:hypothetical protein
MAEPISSTATGIGIKFYGFTTLLLVAALLSWLLVVMTRMPRSRREWAVSLISTLIGSISGGAYVIHSYQLHSWGESLYGALALCGVIFICGLPVWAIIRWVFNYINKHEDSDIFEIADDFKEHFDKFKGDKK